MKTIKDDNLRYANVSEAVSRFKKTLALADSNLVAAQYAVALMFEKGHGTPVNEIKAKEYYEKSLAGGAKEANLKLGCLLLYSDQVKDLNKANEYLKAACRENQSDAIFHLGNLFRLQKNIAAAKWCYETSFNQFGNTSALTSMAGMYSENNNDQESIKYLKMGADLEVNECLLGLGECYFNGEGIDVNLQSARTCFHKALEKVQSADSYAKLGAVEMEMNLEDEALVSLQRSLALKKDPDTLMIIACIYQNQGKLSQAVESFKLAVDEGSEESKISLGEIYENGGEAISQDIHKAIEYYQSYQGDDPGLRVIANQKLAVLQSFINEGGRATNGMFQEHDSTFENADMTTKEQSMDNNFNQPRT